jgi:class 3 adenylate cyclase
MFVIRLLHHTRIQDDLYQDAALSMRWFSQSCKCESAHFKRNRFYKQQLDAYNGEMSSQKSVSPLASIEPRLRGLLPADLYAQAWVEPTSLTLEKVFEHLRTLQRILYDYVPRQVAEALPNPGELRHEWQEGTMMFTDLAGFTPLMEASAERGLEGAKTLLTILSTYFAEMIEITSKSGGNLLEFTGDAMLIQFPPGNKGTDAEQAVRSGLRMQRAMAHFANIKTSAGTFALGMRIGIHTGRFFTADIGTPMRMEHVLLGSNVQRAKHAEGAGQKGRVNVSTDVYERLKGKFRFEPGNPGYMLVIDDLTPEQLGEYDLALGSRRLSNPMLFDRSVEGLIVEIERSVRGVEPLACFIPDPVLNLLVENAARREIPPDFPSPTVVFVNLIGLPESVDISQSDEEDGIVSSFSRVFAQINAAVSARGGILKKVTYHLAGSDMMILFGVPNAHTDDTERALEAAIAIREIIHAMDPPRVGNKPVNVSCKIGIARGSCFAAEVGEPRGRREFNVLGDTVNTAARLMGLAIENRVFMTETVYEQIKDKFECDALGKMPLKGKSTHIPIFGLKNKPKEKMGRSTLVRSESAERLKRAREKLEKATAGS